MERIVITAARKREAVNYANNLFTEKNGNFVHPQNALNTLIYQLLHFNCHIEDPLPFCAYLNKIINEWNTLNCLLPSQFDAKKAEFDEILPEEMLGTPINKLSFHPSKDFDPDNLNNTERVPFYSRISECLHYSEARLEMGQFYSKQLGIHACVYCNAQPARTSKKRLFYTIDHYKPQSKYPFLCTSFFNLIPSCSTCNDIKNDNDIDFEFYTEDVGTKARSPFRFWVENLITTDTRNPEDFDIQLLNEDYSCGGMAESHWNDFHLADMYEECKEDVEDVIWRFRDRGNEAYLLDKPAELIDKTTLYRYILSLKHEDINIHSEVLKKLKLDLAIQLRLIDKNGNMKL